MKIIDSLAYKAFKLRNKYIGGKIYQNTMALEPRYGLSNNDKKVIVSLTTFAARYHTIIPTLKSLLNQTYKPDKIIVWLDDDIPENKITNEMQEYMKYGIEYRNTSMHLKPHTKYFYAMQEFNDALIITVDDDLVYSSDLIESLVKTHIAYPNCICARRVHRIRINTEGDLLPYKEWEYECRSVVMPSLLLCATGCGGVLYPANIMPKETFNADLIRELCLRADDIWLKIMELNSDIKVVWVPSKYVMPYEVNGSQEIALNTINTNTGGNDKYLSNLFKKYPIAKERLVKAYESIKNR